MKLSQRFDESTYAFVFKCKNKCETLGTMSTAARTRLRQLRRKEIRETMGSELTAAAAAASGKYVFQACLMYGLLLFLLIAAGKNKWFKYMKGEL